MRIRAVSWLEGRRENQPGKLVLILNMLLFLPLPGNTSSLLRGSTYRIIFTLAGVTKTVRADPTMKILGADPSRGF